MSIFRSGTSFILSTKKADGSTREIDGTTAIAISFVFLAYFLHPAIEKAYNRVRAYRAWRAIEKREAVEVTSYSMTSEIFGARGIWDAARSITFLLAAFSLASWGLELQLGLADIQKGPVTLLNSPPHVTELQKSVNLFSWEVRNQSNELNPTQAPLWNMDDDFDNGAARSRYHVENYTLDKVNGDITVAWWSKDVEDRGEDFHYYNTTGKNTVVESLLCSKLVKNATISKQGEEEWGTVNECEEGPSRLGATNTSKSPPTIIMNETAEGTVHIIVEESSSYPSFLYSVWTSGEKVEDGVEIHYSFHIASTMRLVEAVVTGIVHRLENGGSCFGLLRQYSEEYYNKDEPQNASRASPFGEKPDFGEVETLDQVENIEAGVEVSIFALLCAVWLMVLTSIGFAWSLCLRKSIGMDVYDRDELIRAVSMPVARGGTDANNSESNSPPSAIRIFVRKEDAGQISVAVSEAAKGVGLFERLFKRGGTVMAHEEPTPDTAATVNEYNAGFGGAAVPVGPRTVWLEGQGMRTGLARAFPGPRGNFVYPSIALTASPVPSTVGSLAVTPSQAASIVTSGHNLMLGRGPSVLFDGGYSPDSSRSEEDVETGCVDGEVVGGRGGVSNSNLIASGETSPARNALGTDITTERRNGEEAHRSLSGATSPATSGGSSSVPPRVLTTAVTQSPPQLLRLVQEASAHTRSAGSEEELKENCTERGDDDLV